MPDDDLAAAILGGVEIAVFDNLYAAYAREARTTARAFIGDAELAADAVHTAYLELFRQVLAGRRWATPEEARAAVHRNVRWAALSLLRRRRLERSPLPVAAPGEDVSVDWARSEARSLCEQIIARLRSRDREALTLYYVEGLRTREAAQRLGISPHAFESRLSRALRAARESARRSGATPLVASLAGRPRRRMSWLRRCTTRCRRALAGAVPVAATTAVVAASWSAASNAGGAPASRIVLQSRAAAAAPPASAGGAVDTPDDVVALDAVVLPGDAPAFAVLGWGRTCQCWLVMRSPDGGSSWSLQRVPPAGGFAARLALSDDPRHPGLVVLPGRPGGAHVRDTLRHAVPCPADGRPIPCPAVQGGGGLRGAVLSTGGGRILYLMPSQGILCSGDMGRTWSLRC